MKEAMDRLVRYLVSCARAFELDAADILTADVPPRSQASYQHENYKYVHTSMLMVQLPVEPTTFLTYSGDDHFGRGINKMPILRK